MYVVERDEAISWVQFSVSVDIPLYSNIVLKSTTIILTGADLGISIVL